MLFDKFFKPKAKSIEATHVYQDELDTAGKIKSANTANNLNVGRNDLCPCGSGKKYKKCCLAESQETSNQVVGYVALDFNSGNVFCSGPDCIVAGSKKLLQEYLSDMPVKWKPTIQEVFALQMKTVLLIGGTYVLDMEAYERWKKFSKDMPEITVVGSDQQKPSDMTGYFAPRGGCVRVIGTLIKQ